MRCPDEFALSQYADGELSKNEFIEMDSHLAACRVCRTLVAGLKAENRLLVTCLQGIDSGEGALETARQERPELSNIDRLAAALIGLVVLLRIGLGFLEKSELPSALQWLHPWSLSGLLNWLMNGLFYILEEGGSFMTSLVDTAGLVLLGLLLVGGTIALTRRAIRAKAIMGLVSLLFAFAVPGYAIDIRKADKGMKGDVSVAANETIDDTLVVFADSVNVSGTITGDLIAFARSVDIQGTVQGNVISFGQRIDIAGNVDGDVFAFGQSLRADGQIGRSIFGFGQTATLGKGVRLNKDAVLFASNVFLNGDVGRDAFIGGGTLDVRSTLARDLRFGGGALMIHSPSVIGRNLKSNTKSIQEVKIDPGVVIRGHKKLEFYEARPNRYRTFGFYTKQALRIGAMFLMGLILYWIAPGLRRISFSNAKTVLTSGGVGFLAAVATPIAAVILAITLLGIPVALLLIALWLLGLFLAKIVIAKWIGATILGTGENGLSSTFLPLLVGLIIVIVAVNLPYIGGILNFILILVGLGALVKTLYGLRPAAASLNS